MKKLVLSLFVAFSLLASPMAHAADVNCEVENSQSAEKVSDHSASKKQTDNKIAKSGHHCCTHVSALPDLIVSKSTTADASRTVFATEQDVVTSVVVGPPLKPPSYL